MQSCSATTKAGKPCRAPAMNGSTMCFLHTHPGQARSLGQAGGQKNRQQIPEPIAISTMNASEITAILAQTICDLRAKKITPHAAGAIAQLCKAAHLLNPTLDLEGRVARLEQEAAERERVAADASVAPEVVGNATGPQADTPTTHAQEEGTFARGDNVAIEAVGEVEEMGGEPEAELEVMGEVAETDASNHSFGQASEEDGGKEDQCSRFASSKLFKFVRVALKQSAESF